MVADFRNVFVTSPPGGAMDHTLAKSIKAVAYLVVLLLVVGIAYAAYISLTYFDGIGV